ncbi:MAG: glycosyltransferase family 4 protein [Oscillospiraceae bacterium]
MHKICYVATVPLTIRSFFIPQIKFLSNKGFDVSVICSPDDSIALELGGNITFIPVEIPRGISVVGSLKAMKNLYNVFKKEKFDLIQYSTPNAALYTSVAAKLAGCNIRNYHLMGLRYLGTEGFGKVILKTLEKMTCRFSTHVECVSRSNMEMGIREGLFPKEKVTVVWNGSSGGVDLSRFDYSKREQWRKEVREELGYTDSDFAYGFVGRITGDKGINELLQAYFSLQTTDKLFLIGRTEDNQTLNPQLIEKTKNDSNIQFHAPAMDIERYFAAIDVLILPSHREGFGNVIIEAAAMGVPAIVSDIPGPTDAIERDKTALAVPVKDAGALAKAMKEIKSRDYVTMGQNAVQYVREKFDSSVLCEKVLERKQELLSTSIVKSK